MPLIEDRLATHAVLMSQARAERSDVTENDEFLPHELNQQVVAALHPLLAAEPEIDSAHAARKQVRHLPNQPFYVLALTVKSPWWWPRSEKANQKLVARVMERLSLPGGLMVFAAERNMRALGKKVAAVPSALVYRRRE